MRNELHLAIVVPTRNREEMAAAALASIAKSEVAGHVSVYLSDNSSEPSAFLEARVGDLRKTNPARSYLYMRPPGDMDMSDHWDWAARRALALSQATHVLFLTDRSVLNAGGLHRLMAACAESPDRVVSFPAITLDDRKTPVHLFEDGWSGEVLRVSSRRLLDLAAQAILSPALPRMLNSAVPALLLHSLEATRGRLFASTAPDFFLCFRLLARDPEIMFIDRPIITMHGLLRSNGASTSTGVLSPDTRDFLEREQERNRWGTARFGADVITTYRIILDEYRKAAEEYPLSLPPFNRKAYLRAFALETDAFEDGELRRANTEALRTYGVQFGHAAHLSRSTARGVAYWRVLGSRDFLVQVASRIRSRSSETYDTSSEALIALMSVERRARSGAGHLDYLRAT